MDVTVTDSVLVKPVKSTPHHQLWVSNIDLVMLRCHSAIAYIYRRPPTNGELDVGQVLKDALSKVLVDFYPLAGRLTVDNSCGRIAVDCNGEGALFVEAVNDSAIDDFGDFTSPSQLTTLVPSATYHNGFTKSPLLMIQVTKFRCGGVALGTGIQHILADGVSSLHFVNSFCDVAREILPE
ncbi:hydroxycinnamoyltransferase-like [Cryptomeria japonica]|uniref:hydroxycinnamoyltransferase-like n=1 Tax=Cryptomeria japonica TaxID=3369 RepID=UPI0027D9F511|nr:hydroxycinnamoyltransferase-like [Cryptomeria japonica]